MNDTRFTHALNIVLLLDKSGCLKQGAVLSEQKPVNQCNRQIEAIRIIYEFLCQLYPATSEGDLTNSCPHCCDHDVN